MPCQLKGQMGELQPHTWQERPDRALCSYQMPYCLEDLLSLFFFFLQRVTSDTALKFLQSLKYSYTKQELLESELAVLNTLHFHINVSTPLAYVELLLEVLGESIRENGREVF